MEDDLEERARAQGDRGKKKGRGGGGRRGGMGREVQVSKALSRLLRHQAEGAGIKLDEAGFAELDKVVSLIPITPPLLSGVLNLLGVRNLSLICSSFTSRDGMRAVTISTGERSKGQLT